MDSTAQDPNQIAQQPQNVSQPPDQPQDASAVSSVVTPPSDQQTTVPLSAPIGGKEHAAISVPDVQPSHPEVVVPEAVKAAGVESSPNPEVIQLTAEQKQAGIEPAKEATPLPQMPSLHLPIPEEKVASVLKVPNPKNSITWLALLIKKILQMQRRKK